MSSSSILLNRDTYSRPLRNLEICERDYFMNILVTFKCEMEKEQLIEAIVYIKQIFPYLSMRLDIERDQSPSSVFLKYQTPEDIQKPFVEFFRLKSLDELNNWKLRYLEFGARLRDIERSVVFYELYSFENNHQLIVGLNHAASDGMSMVEIIKELFKTVDRILKGEKLEKVEDKLPLDIHEDYSKFIDVSSLIDMDSALKRIPIPADEFHNHLRFIDLRDEVAREKIYTELKLTRMVEHLQLNEEATKTLLENSRQAKSTVQGLLSLAVAICMVHEKFDLNQLKSTDSLSTGCSIPVNQRFSFNLPNSEVLAMAGMLSWEQKIESNKPLLSMASDATKSLHDLRNSNAGLEYLVRVNLSLPNEDDFVGFGSSMGVVSLNESNLNHIKIDDFRFSKSNCHFPTRSADKPFITILLSHAYTFANRFNFNVNYSYPHFSNSFGRHFAKNLYNLISFMARSDSIESTLADVLPFLKRFNDISDSPKKN